jgi:nickel-dependent lactate racemase
VIIRLPYGEGEIAAPLDWAHVLGTLDVADTPALPNLAEALRDALEAPVGLSRPLLADFRPGERVGIIVSDSFRSTGFSRYAGDLLDQLLQRGVSRDAIDIFIATGTHRGPTPEEQAAIVTPLLNANVRVHVHDAHTKSGLVYLGATSRGTPVWINKALHECDRILVSGAVVLHYFGGFGGGRKSVVPGMAGVETIAHNHALNLDPDSDRLNPDVRIGRLAGNPVAEDMLEAARFQRVDGIINTVLNRSGHICGLFVGELEAAHEAACRFAADLFRVPIAQQADLVIAASGPTKNFVQTHKALYNAWQAMKPGGRIVLAAACPEGLGGRQFTQWLELGNRARIIQELRKHSEINGQTALSTIEKAPQTCFVTGLSARDVALLGGRRAEGLEEALEWAREALTGAGAGRPTCYVMPSAAYTVPEMGDETRGR